MSNFVQLHFLTVYPPSNPNRDDMGRPKTAVYGGVPRLRISSQSLKRAVRLSPVMLESLQSNMGQRTRRIGEEILDYLLRQGAKENQAREIAKKVAEIFGKFDATKAKSDESAIQIRQLAFISPDERKAAIELAQRGLDGESLDVELKTRRKEVLQTADGAVDIAMFGRMLADSAEFNREAALQVSHAFTTHRADAEDDFYTAVDDLKNPTEDMGAGFVGEAGFGSGVYYLYVCVDIAQLVSNLAGDCKLACKALESVIEAFATASPSGKRNSYSHHTRASFIRAEAGDQQPRSLAAAFLKPVQGSDYLDISVSRLRETAKAIDDAYGPTAHGSTEMYIKEAVGSLNEIKEFVSRQVPNA